MSSAHRFAGEGFAMTAGVGTPGCPPLADRHCDDARASTGASFNALPTQHPAWIALTAEVFGAPGGVASFALPGSRLTMPMARTVSTPRRLILAGAIETGEPGDLMAANAEVLESLAGALANQPLAVELTRIPSSSPSIPALRRAFRRRGVMLIRPATGSPTIELDPSWALPELKFNAGRRSDFRRSERHAEKLGGATFEIHESLTESRLDALMTEAYEVEARSWKGDGGTALADDPVRGPFFRRFALAAMNDGMLRLAIMRVGGRAVGMQLGIEWGQRLWLFKIGYDPAYSKCSPGTLLMLHTLRDSAERGLKSFEFLGGPAPWTQVWTTTLRPYVRLMLFPFSLAGMAALALQLSSSMGARLRRRNARVGAPATGSRETPPP